jgi:hypothetical protein
MVSESEPEEYPDDDGGGRRAAFLAARLLMAGTAAVVLFLRKVARPTRLPIHRGIRRRRRRSNILVVSRVCGGDRGEILFCVGNFRSRLCGKQRGK